ncbi:iron-siderophore ABC transporter substrate-binding protein [Ensifer sp. 4252]|uniref:iron-siderophore ABC transporter substrate-binding protein n=1 Tax=Ensifer sp. 4252 TaxID=3373915 RepID=UPI003D19657B
MTVTRLTSAIGGATGRLLSRRAVVAGGFASLLARASFGQTPSFPVTVEHALGATIVPTRPRRIVTVGWCDEDSVLAFGETPVGMVRRGMFESGIAPWCEAKLGGVRPRLLDGGQADYETILGLEPDLIVNVFSDMDARSYERLSAIAPTVGYASGPWRADWREQTRQIGKALGRSPAAETLIDRTRLFLAALARQNGRLAGRSFTFGTYFPGSGSMVVYLPGETRVDWLIDLGMRVAPGIARLSRENPGRSSLDISLEQLELVESDVLIMWYEGGARGAMESQPLFQLFRPVSSGAYVALEDPVSVWSASWPSVLAIPYGFPGLVPRLAQAIGVADSHAGKEP